VSRLNAQTPVSPAAPAAPIVAYRPPALALAQPLDGGTVPQDKPVVVFRFVAGERDDPVDVRTFAVTFEGLDRSTAFQLDPGTGTAWGSLDAGQTSLPLIVTAPQPLSIGVHRGTARVCSQRGMCSTTAFSVVIAPPIGSAAAATTNAAAPSSNGPSKKSRVLGGLLKALQSLISP
jgi:hypothetical protein